MCVTRADSKNVIQETAAVGQAAVGGETNKEAGSTSGMYDAHRAVHG